MTDRPRVTVTQPHLAPLPEYVKYLESVWATRQLTNNGPMVQRLKAQLETHLGVTHLSLTSNGTTALMLALRALKITGDVITTPYSFVATSHALLLTGATPVFVDIDPVTLNLDPSRIESAITPRTTAILAVHCYGHPCDVDAIAQIARRHRLRLVYDAAHAFGVQAGGKSVLSYGDASALSFHATKVFSTVEGGGVVAANAALAAEVDCIRDFGISDENTILQLGLNGKMSELHAAFGLMQLKHIRMAIEKRRGVDLRYRAGLEAVQGIQCLPSAPGSNHAYFPILVRPGYPLTRDQLFSRLQHKGFMGRRYFYPLISNLPMYQTLASAEPGNLPRANLAAEQVICLPIYPDLALEVVDEIVQLIGSPT